MTQDRRKNDSGFEVVSTKLEGIEALMREKDGRVVEHIAALDKRLSDHITEEDQLKKELKEFMAETRINVTVAKALWAVAKALGAVVLVAATLRWGDIPQAFFEGLSNDLHKH